MPSYFFDTSAIAKRYWYEQGANWVRAVCNNRGAQPVLYLSELAQAEVVAAIRRTGRKLVQQQGYHRSAIDASVNLFERDVQRSLTSANPVYEFVPLRSHTVQLAQRLCDRFWLSPTPSLRSLDAIQLASAIIARGASSVLITFVTADTDLEKLAQAVGFTTDNPMRHQDECLRELWLYRMVGRQYLHTAQKIVMRMACGG